MAHTDNMAHAENMVHADTTHKYDDIIHLPHPTSKVHPRMSLSDRAAQFAPFAALTGHGAAISETARLTQQPWEMTEDSKARLDSKLQILRDQIDTAAEVTFTYFVPDERKSGGGYVTCTGRIKKMDEYEHRIIMEDQTVIPMEQIGAIEGELFADYELFGE